MKKLLFITAMLTLLSPFAAWAMYKPMRVLAPSWVDGITCISSEICLEDKSQYKVAEHLYRNALGDVSQLVGLFKENPRVIFCSTENCYQSFGFKNSSATNVGTSGIVVSPRGWKAYYLRHEMIHHRQSEEFGVISSLFKPEWLIEGMTYSLSGDPRKRLSDRWQSDRDKFNHWIQSIGMDKLWEEAKKI